MHACQVIAFMLYMLAAVLAVLKHVPYAVASVAAGLAFGLAPVVFELHS